MRRIILPCLLALSAAQAQAALELDQHSFTLDGYLRIGAGLGKEAGRQVDFQAPGARSKYRLGNEADTKVELGVTHRYRLHAAMDAPSVSTTLMLKGQADHEDDIQIDDLAQAYVQFDGFFESGISVWMGRRYYDRQMVDWTEHAWLNVGEGAQLGAGFEGWQFGPGKVALAMFRYNDPDGASVDGERTGTVYTTAFDLRYSEITVGESHKVTLWGALSQRHENEDLEYLNKMGLGGGFWVDSANLAGGEHRLAVLLFSGPLNTQGDFTAVPAREELGFDLSEAMTIEMLSDFRRELGDNMTLQTQFLMRHELRGVNDGVAGDIVMWVSGGGRLQYFLSDYVSVAGELGVDNVTNELVDTQGSLVKTTFAVQLSPAKGFFAPPVLRSFITFASWDKDFQGAVGGELYAEDTAGWSAGMQVEHRW